QRSSDSGRVVRKVVDDGDAVHLSTYFKTPLHALECLKRGRNLLFSDAATGSHRRRGGRIPNVVFACQSELKIRPMLLVSEDTPTRSRSQLKIANLPKRVVAAPISLDGTKCPADAALHAHTRVKRHDAPAPWHEVHQSLERCLDSVEVFIDVRMIEL